MPVDTQHPQYISSRRKWQRMRDAIAGDDAIQAAGVRYLPALSGQSKEEYAAYLRRATFFNATGRTSHALHGLIFRKPATVDAPAALKDAFEDITMSGKSVSDLAEDIARELIDVGRVAVLVDFPAVDEASAPMNAAAAAASGHRPYATVYLAESVLNWGVGRVRNASQLVFIALDETGLVLGAGDDPYEHKLVERIRVLKLDEAGLYVQEIHEKAANGWTLTSSATPMSNGKRLDAIPLVIGNAGGLTADVSDPPMLDLVDVNLSHFRTSADLEHGAHFTGLPTPWVTGYTVPPDMNYEPGHPDYGKKADVPSFAIGSSTVWVLPNENTQIGYLEFTGNGLGTLKDLLDRKEQQMSVLGARMLAGEKAGVEATSTLEIRTNAETSVLATIAVTTARMLQKVCELIAAWSGVSGKVTSNVNKDFMPTTMSPQLFAQLLAGVQAGQISPQTFFWNLQQGELVPDGKTYEDEEAQIEASTPALTMPTPVVPGAPAPAPKKTAEVA